MTDSTVSSTALVTSDGVPLKQSLARAERRSKIRALLLVAPLFLFIMITFVIPIFDMLFRSVDNPRFQEVLPETAQALMEWEGGGLPPEELYATMAAEMKAAMDDRTLGRLTSRLNFEDPGMRTLMFKTARRLNRVDEGPWKEVMIGIDDEWADPDVWALMKRTAPAYTMIHYLNSFDLTVNAEGEVVSQPEELQIYGILFWRTIWMSLLITGLCALLGFPIAYLLATLPTKHSNLLMILVLLPFWTSLLVRTTTWIVLLQTEGVINDILVWLSIINDDQRIQMIYNQTGTIVAMTHILLPFMVLPLYSVMKTIDPSYMRAARSLGATQVTAFTRIYFPNTIPGLGAGGILVFILAIGYYITPALVGGRTGQLISNFIAFHMQESLNWGLGAALGSVLLASVLVLYWLYNRLIGIDNMKFG